MFLALDTVTHFCSVALADADGNLLASFHEAQERGHAETIVPLIERAFKKAGAAPDALTGIVVTTGPGTFAGVRIGLSAARALSFATGAKILGLTSFEALMGLAFLRGAENAPPFVLAAVPGRGGEWGAELFSRAKGKTPPWQSVKGPAAAAMRELQGWLAGKSVLVAGAGAEQIAEQVSGKALLTLRAWPRAEDLLRIKDYFPRGRWGRGATPFYLRPPDATPSVIVPHG